MLSQYTHQVQSRFMTSITQYNKSFTNEWTQWRWFVCLHLGFTAYITPEYHTDWSYFGLIIADWLSRHSESLNSTKNYDIMYVFVFNVPPTAKVQGPS